MRLLEHQAKDLFTAAGLAVPRGGLAERASRVSELVEAHGPRVVVKAQVRSGGRGRAGAVAFADGPDQAQQAAERLLGSQLAGEVVDTVLIEQRLDVTMELYLALTTDRDAGCPLAILGRAGGVDVEQAAVEQPESLARVHFDPVLRLADYQVRYLVGRTGLDGDVRTRLSDVVKRLEAVYFERDALLAEINPLALLASGDLVALDGRVEIDDNALFRQPEIESLRQLSETEQQVEAAGFHYVEMDGQVGLISTGSGACMALMDLLSTRQLAPANFMELGQSMGTGGAEVATEILLRRPQIEAILVAGYSGGPLERLAKGVLAVLERYPDYDLPVVVSLQGRNDTEAMKLAAESGDGRVSAAAGYQAAVSRLAELLAARRAR